MSLGEWLKGIKSAWHQARQEYQLTRRKGRKLDRSSCANDASKVNYSRRMRRPIGPSRSLSRSTGDKPSDRITEDLSRAQESCASISVEVPSNTILNESFLKEVNRQRDRISPIVTDSGTNKTRRKAANVDGAENGLEEMPKIVPPTRTGTKRSLSCVSDDVIAPEMSREYISRMQRRMKQLEIELEEARNRLSLYERSEGSTSSPTQGNVRSDESMKTFSQQSLTQLSNSIVPDSGVNNNSSSEISYISVMQDDHNVFSAEDDSFYLSPSKLLLSPVQLSIADLTNGEIARKEAVQALKHRIQQTAQ